MGGARRAAVRLLPVGPGHGRRRAPEEKSSALGQGNRRGDDQHLPLRDVSAHPRSGAPGGGPDENGESMKNPARRKFIIDSAVVTGGLAVGFHLAFAFPADKKNILQGTEVNAWVVVNPDNTCVIRVARSEMGQGTHTGLLQLVAEELECDWKKVRIDQVTAGENYARKRVWGEMGTGGSRGIRISQDYVRRGGAVARVMLLQAAADPWKVPVDELMVSHGGISHQKTKRSITYRKVASAAATLTPPDPKSLKLKDPKDWKIAGKPVLRLDTADKVNGQKIYGIDLKLPGMLHAAVRQSPVFGGTLVSFDEAKIAGMPGVKRAAKVNHRPVAVGAASWV